MTRLGNNGPPEQVIRDPIRWWPSTTTLYIQRPKSFQKIAESKVLDEYYNIYLRK
jgi:hypothetical protein